MTYRTLFNRLIIVAFLVLVGYSLARSIHYKSFIGIILALTSLGATVYFLYLLAKAKQEAETETEESA